MGGWTEEEVALSSLGTREQHLIGAKGGGCGGKTDQQGPVSWGRSRVYRRYGRDSWGKSQVYRVLTRSSMEETKFIVLNWGLWPLSLEKGQAYRAKLRVWPDLL